MTQRVGYWVDLNSVQLNESNGSYTSWIQAMTTGTYHHPVYGDISITMERIRRFAQNIKDKVRGIDLDVDYDHKERNGEAAGWIKQAEARSDGLWVLVEWTKEAAEKIKNKAYRYFSPEFVDEWEHPKTKQKFRDVLFGGGITNRPFLKDIQPINMSEVFASDRLQGGQMDPKKLRELLGLPEDATEEQVTTALTEKLTQEGTQDPHKNEEVGSPASKLNEGLDEEVIRRLAEDNPVVKALAERVENQAKELAEASAAIRLAEVSSQVLQLSETASAKQRAIPAPVLEKIKALLIKMPKALGEEVFDAVKELAEKGFVDLGEKGKSRGDSDVNDAEKRFNDAVAEFQKSNEGVSYADAVETVASQQPQLFADYQQSAYAFAE